MEILVLNGIINGFIVGGIYALIGMSLTLLYGVLRIVNFAHGEFVIGGSFLAYALFSNLGLAPLLSLPVASSSPASPAKPRPGPRPARRPDGGKAAPKGDGVSDFGGRR
jgi:branched-subunit amino acid ABC-type transport system permease component